MFKRIAHTHKQQSTVKAYYENFNGFKSSENDVSIFKKY